MALTKQEIIEMILANDEASTDEELLVHLMQQFALTEAEAAAQIANRDTLLKFKQLP